MAKKKNIKEDKIDKEEWTKVIKWYTILTKVSGSLALIFGIGAVFLAWSENIGSSIFGLSISFFILFAISTVILIILTYLIHIIYLLLVIWEQLDELL